MGPVVVTFAGKVRGVSRDGITRFLGIPFAAAPEGPLRFRPPVSVPGWDGVRDTVAFGAAPPQLAPAPGAPAAWRPGDGLDCLTVNVWTPEPGRAGLPVMVWIYGGQWKHGSASMPHYDAATLAGSGVVVVTFNYRVGFEGFGHLLGAEDNRGLRDQIAALEWVRENIAAFGGDPANVTLFGQSAGAASVALLMAAPAARGLFRRAIAQSVPSGVLSADEAGAATATIAAAAGVPATREAFAALPPEAILAVQDAPLRERDGFTAFAPVIDGDLVTGSPWVALRSGAGRDVDLLCGFTHEEYRGQGPMPPPGVDLAVVATAVGLEEEAVAAYRRAYPAADDAELFTVMLSDALIRMPTTWVAEAHAGSGGRAWLYDFAWRGPTLGAGHGVDVPFVFGTPETRPAARFLGSPPPADFAGLSERVRTAWTSFAATGDPGWPCFTPDRPTTRIWDTTPADAPYPLEGSRRIWQRRGTSR
ncbi:carboxylesterase/lipase family protein [Streptomyces sp. UNOB3_S3]|uniref:carboxylesterase/lipase family protein n=1 Tax=Streptomyces sp. UNOB3_S3 TaxID=2871682 RepID=UPI001E2B760C|nr:carboxylesterase family protein [Streptomyces sp. UNOB3_S3]MCC3776148.1 carboxylesterase family protein [Streptomyces sp. UNOB3_S3]